jgi:demethylmenaquinone methyltransferase/2-methoxy-6-polyprenyl-1,4-benzoquinol methylase
MGCSQVSVQPEQVREMFDRISSSYDRMNRVMSLGMDGRWRAAAVRAARLAPGDAALDVCCGTGDLAIELRRAVGPGGRAVGLDFSEQMLDVARAKSTAIEWAQGDALALPFADDEFAAATVAWGVRNLADREGGFREMARVVRPGGRIVCLEMSQPPGWAAPFARVWTDRAVPVLGRVLAGDGDAYTYLPESAKAFPGAPELASIMRAAGLTTVGYRRLMLGVVAIHVGEAP